jgi:hypothetical protein
MLLSSVLSRDFREAEVSSLKQRLRGTRKFRLILSADQCGDQKNGERRL